MPIKQITPITVASDYLENSMKFWKRSVVQTFSYAAESALKEARENHGYVDRTGNLTSSIGYCILDEGVVLYESSFEQVITGAKGAEEGKKFIDELIKDHSEGTVALMVASMGYSVYVEALGYNVLDSAEQLFLEIMKRFYKLLK